MRRKFHPRAPRVPPPIFSSRLTHARAVFHAHMRETHGREWSERFQRESKYCSNPPTFVLHTLPPPRPLSFFFFFCRVFVVSAVIMPQRRYHVTDIQLRVRDGLCEVDPDDILSDLVPNDGQVCVCVLCVQARVRVYLS